MKTADPKTGICFFRATQETTLLNWLDGMEVPDLSLKLTADQITKWLDFGAIYVDGKRATLNQSVFPNQLLRLHTRPKHYTLPKDRLADQIVFEHEEFLVIDKPGGLPVHPTLDNRIENVKHLLEIELRQQLFSTHRLDIPTQGLLILAKTRDAQVLINKLFAKKRVQKIYCAISDNEVTPGHYTHFLDPATRVPRIIDRQFHEGWWECRLEVLAVNQCNEGFAHQVRLITGRTHQIRAQFQDLGAPIVGDEVYGGRPYSKLLLSCESLAFRYRTSDILVQRSASFRN